MTGQRPRYHYTSFTLSALRTQQDGGKLNGRFLRPKKIYKVREIILSTKNLVFDTFKAFFLAIFALRVEVPFKEIVLVVNWLYFHHSLESNILGM